MRAGWGGTAFVEEGNQGMEKGETDILAMRV